MIQRRGHNWIPFDLLVIKTSCFWFGICGNWDVGNFRNTHSAHIKHKSRSQEVWTTHGLTATSIPHTSSPINPEFPTKYHQIRAQKTMCSCSLLADYLFIGITVSTNYEKGSKTHNCCGFSFFCTVAGVCIRVVCFFYKAVSIHGISMMYNYR